MVVLYRTVQDCFLAHMYDGIRQQISTVEHQFKKKSGKFIFWKLIFSRDNVPSFLFNTFPSSLKFHELRLSEKSKYPNICRPEMNKTLWTLPPCLTATVYYTFKIRWPLTDVIQIQTFTAFITQLCLKAAGILLVIYSPHQLLFYSLN